MSNDADMRRSLAATLGMFLVLSPLSFAAATPPARPPSVQVWVAERTTRAETNLELEARQRSTDGASLLYASVSVDLDPASLRIRRTMSGSIFSYDHDLVPRGYGMLAAASCPTPPPTSQVCETHTARTGRTIATLRSPAGDGGPDRLYLVLRSHEISVRLTALSKGWVVRRVPTARARIVGADEAAATGAHSALAGVEVFSSAESEGGARGSIAMARPPCDTALSVGRVRLLGGSTDPAVSCTLTTSSMHDFSPRQTRWVLSGPAAGVTTSGIVRLIVVDL